MPQLSASALRVQHSGIREIVNLVLASEQGSIARLEIGEPGFLTPSHIVEAAVDAARGPTRYTHSAGMWELRAEIADSIQRRYSFAVPPERIVVAQGAGQGLSAVFSATLSPGDEVLIPDPAWPNYEMLVRLHGAIPVPYALDPQSGFMPEVSEIAALIGDHTRAIVLNSPGNPTGAVMPRELVEQIVELAVAADLLVVSDEVYDELIFEGEAVMAAAIAPDHAVSVFSFSKTYAMTGWRVGYVLSPPWLAEVLAHVQEPLLSCISSVSQAAALAALRGPQECVALMRDTYRGRRDSAVTQLRDGGIDVAVPAGAFYLMVPLAPGTDSRAAALELVGQGVATAPGTAFGAAARDYLRLSLASEDEVLATGIDRFLAWNTGRS